MKTFVAFILFAGSAAADVIPVPSGQVVEFADLIMDAEGEVEETWRFRFIAPGIARDGGTIDTETAFVDMQALCDAFIAPALARKGVAPGQVIVSLSDRPVEFGQANPEATQFFEAFALRDGKCEWEGF